MSHHFRNNLLEFITRIAVLFISLFLSIIILRVYEYISVSKIYKPALLFWSKGIINDVYAISKYFLLITLVNLVLYKYKNVANILSHSFNAIYLVIYGIAVAFFITAIAPLDHSVYTYKVKEIIETIKSENINFTPLVVINLSLLVYALSIFMLRRVNYLFVLGTTILLVTTIPLRNLLNKPDSLTIEKQISISKADYFFYKTYVFFKTKENHKLDPDLTQQISEFVNFRKALGYCIDSCGISDSEIQDYPLLNINNNSILNNIISSYGEKPNIVIIIVESLGYRFFNKNVEKACFYPFLDSLSNESLYWKNCFSTSERTYGAIPSITGSLPYGEKGFSSIQHIPEHLSITSILSSNGYNTYFFYGGWTAFQGMSALLTKQRMGYILDYFPPSYKKMTADREGFAWGYPDGEIYRRSLEILDSINKTPFFALYLSLSTHSPFSIPDRSKYEKKIIQLLNNTNDSQYANRVLSNVEPYIAALYADESLRFLINEFKKRKLYDNTIFIITGDHHMHELGRRNELEVYNVPLIIHSKLIKKKKSYTAIVSHLDIAPTLLNYMKKNGYINFSKIVHWLGTGLDTIDHFPKFIPFMRNCKDVNQCVYKKYFLDENELYEFTDGQEVRLIKNDSLTQLLQKKVKNFDVISKYTSLNHAIIPIKYIYGDSKIFEKKISKTTLTPKENSKLIFSTQLTKNFSEIVFEVKFKIYYTEKFLNPILRLEIYDPNGSFVDYFHLNNENLINFKDITHQYHQINITRRISSPQAFSQNSTLKFYWYNITKKVKIKDFSITLYE